MLISTKIKQVLHKNKKLIFGVTALVPIIFVNLSGSREQVAVARFNSNNRSCEPIAKVMRGDIRHQPLTKLCEEDKVKAVDGRMVEILCYPRGRILKIKSDTVGNHCLPLSNREGRGCTLLDGRPCSNPKGPDEENKPRLVNPYGIVIKNPRPVLSWSSTKTATSYYVRIRGNGRVYWEVEVEGNTLPYPQDQLAMQPGTVYTVDIVAMRSEEVLDGSSSILLLPSTDELQEVEKTIEALKNLKQSEDELAIDMDAVYEARNLVHESITVLNARAKAGSINPTVHRLLGDRYLIAKLPKQANQAYLKALQLAQKANNKAELGKAEAGIKIASQYI